MIQYTKLERNKNMKNENLFIGYVYQVTEVKEVINTYE